METRMKTRRAAQRSKLDLQIWRERKRDGERREDREEKERQREEWKGGRDGLMKEEKGISKDRRREKESE